MVSFKIRFWQVTPHFKLTSNQKKKKIELEMSTLLLWHQTSSSGVMLQLSRHSTNKWSLKVFFNRYFLILFLISPSRMMCYRPYPLSLKLLSESLSLNFMWREQSHQIMYDKQYAYEFHLMKLHSPQICPKVYTSHQVVLPLPSTLAQHAEPCPN